MLKHCSSPSLVKTSSVSSSSESLSEYSQPPRTSIRPRSLVRVYTDCFGNKMSYTTILVDRLMTGKDVIRRMLARMKCKVTDPDMYRLYLAVETQEGVKSVKLESRSRLLDLITCTPWTAFRLVLQAEDVVKIRVWDNISQCVRFRSILVSRNCTVEVAMGILHGFYPHLNVSSLAMFEECPQLGMKRKLSESELPFKIMECWGEGSQCRFTLEKQDIKNNHNSLTRGSFNRKTMDRKMFRFLKSFLENNQEDEKLKPENTSPTLTEDRKISAEKISVNSESFLYIAF